MRRSNQGGHPPASVPTLNPSPQPLLLAGSTASGKSDVALVLAERLGGEIVSVDSMQVYRGLDIGTAKPTLAERQRVRHHVIDVVDMTELFDAARFACLAHSIVTHIQARGLVPILCGGTGLYFKAFLEGLGDAPSANPALRAELEKTPLPDLLHELAECDPRMFQKIDRQNPRRVIRAVEVIRQTGKTFSEQRAQWQTPAVLDTACRARFFGLRRSVDDLRSRIDARVDEMFRRGLVAETERLLEQGLARNRTAMQALGYRQVVEHLAGKRSLAATIALVKTNTRQFAKRQMTWFRRQAELTWIEVRAGESAQEIAARIEQMLLASSE